MRRKECINVELFFDLEISAHGVPSMYKFTTGSSKTVECT